MKKLLILLGLVMFLLYSHMLILHGALKERQGRICIDPATQSQLSKIVETTKSVCVDITKTRLEEADTKLKEAKENANYWRKKFNSIPTTTPNI